MTAEIFKKWSGKEIEKYQQIRRKELDPVYIVKEIPSRDPASRVKYVTNLLEKLGAYDFENDIVNSIARQKGKPKALVHLEETVLIEYQYL